MRFVPTKTPEQQSGLLLHRTRHLFIRQQTAGINTRSWAHLAEFGIVAPVGRTGVDGTAHIRCRSERQASAGRAACACLSAFGAQLRMIKERILEFDQLIKLPGIHGLG